jgi:hypothetical protein
VGVDVGCVEAGAAVEHSQSSLFLRRSGGSLA